MGLKDWWAESAIAGIEESIGLWKGIYFPLSAPALG